MRRILFALLILGFAPIGGSRTEESPKLVSMIQLIATPERYFRQEVTVTGFLYLGFESNRLYLSREDFENQVVGNSICLESNRQLDKDAETASKKYVLVVGTFNNCPRDGGGRIAHIRKYLIWSDPARPRMPIGEQSRNR